jgi:hypothetical protein
MLLIGANLNEICVMHQNQAKSAPDWGWHGLQGWRLQ